MLFQCHSLPISRKTFKRKLFEVKLSNTLMLMWRRTVTDFSTATTIQVSSPPLCFFGSCHDYFLENYEGQSKIKPSSLQEYFEQKMWVCF